MLEYKNAKVKEWNSKMFGFFNKAQVNQEMLRQDEEAALRKKIARQTFSEGHNQAAPLIDVAKNLVLKWDQQ